MSYSTSYIQYNDKSEVENLDQNTWNISLEGIEDGASGGRRIYDFSPRQPAYYICYGGRDKETHYIIGIERENHPDHSSRFGYAKSRNGYGSGHWPGRYNDTEMCSLSDPQPPDMAPSRFYEDEYQGPFTNYSQANVDYFLEKNYGM